MSKKDAEEFEINVLTLNIWCIPHISKDIDRRVNAIAIQLADSNYDVVCLQEVWSEQIYSKIKCRVSSVLPYSHFFYSGVVGSGTCVLSRFPLESAIYQEWPVNGFAHKIHHGDWFGGKGVGLCVLRRGRARIHLYTTHLIAEYNAYDEYACHRVVQAYQMARWVALTAAAAQLVLVVGDLNAEPHDLPYRLVRRLARLSDPGTGDVRATNECPSNSYFCGKTSAGKRIDYVLYRCGADTCATVAAYQLPFPARIPGGAVSFSDHEAVLATLRISTLSPQARLRQTEVRLRQGDTKEFQLRWSAADWEVFAFGEGDSGVLESEARKRDFRLSGKGGDWQLSITGEKEGVDDGDDDNEVTKLIGSKEKSETKRAVKKIWTALLRRGSKADEMVLAFEDRSSVSQADAEREWEVILFEGDEVCVRDVGKKETELLKEAVVVCDDGLRNVAASRCRYVIFSWLCLLGLALSQAMAEVFGITWIGGAQVLVALFMSYSVAMATLGCRMEGNGIRGVKMSMELALNRDKHSLG